MQTKPRHPDKTKKTRQKADKQANKGKYEEIYKFGISSKSG